MVKKLPVASLCMLVAALPAFCQIYSIAPCSSSGSAQEYAYCYGQLNKPLPRPLPSISEVQALLPMGYQVGAVNLVSPNGKHIVFDANYGNSGGTYIYSEGLIFNFRETADFLPRSSWGYSMYSINDLGQIVGSATFYRPDQIFGETYGFIWQKGLRSCLGGTCVAPSIAWDSNNLGDVVGSINSNAFIQYRDGTTANLGQLISGYWLFAANAIDDDGKILAYGRNLLDYRGDIFYILTPERPITAEIVVLPRIIVPASNEIIAVAILTSPEFNAANINPATGRFGVTGIEAMPTLKAIMLDVNGDHKKDMILFFRASQTGIKCGDTNATLTATTFDGKDVMGADSIRTVRCR